MSNEKKYKVNKKILTKKKINNIFILTVDEKYFILDKNYLNKSSFFSYLFNLNKGIGFLGKPIYLQKVHSKYFEVIFKYLRYYKENPEDDLDNTKKLYECYNNNFEKKLFENIEKNYNTEDFNNLLETIQYIGITKLYNKIFYLLIRKKI
jgi:hypothetical protein